MKNHQNNTTAQIGIFNPGRLSDKDIEKTFIARRKVLEQLVHRIAQEATGSIPQHHLVIGQRGMGKSTLLHRIAVEIRKEKHRERFIPLTFPEEQYNVDRLSKFWINCLEAMADALDKEKRTDQLLELESRIDVVLKESIKQPDIAFTSFEEWSNKLGRRAVLLVDNLNLIFSRLSKQEQHELRATLMKSGAPILVGASALTIDETTDYGAPFYDAFQIQYLKKLTLLESLDVLNNLGVITGNTDFGERLKMHEGRLATLYQLTGGTPRTIVMLYPIIQNGFSNDIQTDLDALTDTVTPLYKASFEELSPQLQVILDAIAIHWDPMTLEQLRNATMLDNSQLSPQLKRLADVGWLKKVAAYETSGSAYELSERFFNIWYLMRRSTRRQKRELLCLSKFLESFYGEELQEIGKSLLKSKSEHADTIAVNLAVAGLLKDEEVQTELRNKSYNELMELSKTDATLLKAFQIPEEVLVDIEIKQFLEVADLTEEGKFEAAFLILDRIKLAKGEYAIEKMVRGIVLQAQNQLEDSEKEMLKALELDDSNAQWHSNIGDLYLDMKQVQKAMQAFKEAIHRDENIDSGWFGLAESLEDDSVKKYNEAKEAYVRALEISPDNVKYLMGLSSLLSFKLKDYSEASEILERLIEKSPEESFYTLLGWLSQQLKDIDKAKKCYKQAIAIDSTADVAYDNLTWLLYNDKNYSVAEEFLLKAIEHVNDPIRFQKRLIIMYKYKTKEYRKALEMYALLEESDLTWANGMGNLYLDYLNQPVEAEKAYLKYLEAEEANKEMAYLNLVFLYRDKLNDTSKAKRCFKKVEKENTFKDSYFLNLSLFSMYDKNLGYALELLSDALEEIGDQLPGQTQDDWWRFGAVSAKLGYANDVLECFKEKGYDIMLKPFYMALKAMTVDKAEPFFNSIAEEVREPARDIYEMMCNYNSPKREE